LRPAWRLEDCARLRGGASSWGGSDCPVHVELARSLLVLGRIERRRKTRGQTRAALQRARTLADEIGRRPLKAEIGRELSRLVRTTS